MATGLGQDATPDSDVPANVASILKHLKVEDSRQKIIAGDIKKYREGK